MGNWAVVVGGIAVFALSACSEGKRETPPPSAPKVAGLVAAYPFDEGTGTRVGDVSGHGNHGVTSGTAWVSGKHGQALAFDGVDDWVAVADANSLDLTTGMTLEAWVKPAERQGWQAVVIKEADSTAAYALYANGSEGPATPLPLNKWTHLAASYDASRLTLYVDGIVSLSVPGNGPLRPSAAPLRIGGSIWGEWFAGAIDEVRVYNRALSAAEIKADMDTPITDVPADPNDPDDPDDPDADDDDPDGNEPDDNDPCAAACAEVTVVGLPEVGATHVRTGGSFSND